MVAFIHKLHLNNGEKIEKYPDVKHISGMFKELIYVSASLWWSDTKELLGHALFC